MNDFNNSVKTSYHDSVYLYTDGFKLKEETTKRDCDTIIKYLELKSGDCVLDLACGHGRHSLELAQRNLGSLVGLDCSSEALEIARSNANQQGLTSLRFEQGDLRTMDFNADFDAVISMYSALFYWDDSTHLDVLRRICKALKPGGRIFIDTMNREVFVVSEGMKNSRIRKMLGFLIRPWQWLSRSRRNTVFPKESGLVWYKLKYALNLETGVWNGTRTVRYRGGQERKDELQFRAYSLSELIALLGRAGLEFEKVLGASDEQPYSAISPRMMVIARRKD